MPAFTDADFLATLRQHWGHDQFRGVQLPIVRSICAGHDTLGLMPTGGGKSITFQVPGLMLEGMCLVVSPLIALMKDQVEHLRERGIRAAAIHSGLSREAVMQTLDNAIFSAYEFLYVSPERLESELFRQKVRRMHVSFITVDEAHCISQWGYDFRPSYLQIARLRELLPDVPVLALTATATPRVADDICAQLRFRPDAERHRMSFARKQLAYVVRHADNKEQELLHILRSVEGSAIVYVRSRQATRDVAKLLTAEGITAHYYHAALTNIDKDVRQRAWQEGHTRVMVATNAFGMGIDKANVRLVVHLDVPDSVEAYFQEAGRAGRDGQRAYAVLLCNGQDRTKLRRRVSENFPEPDYLCRVYNSLAYYFQLAVGDGYRARYEFSLEEFCLRFHYFPTQAESALRLLTRAGYIDYIDEAETQSRVQMLMNRDELYALHGFTEADRVLQAILRTYSGLFADYVAIDEQHLAQQTGYTPAEVYELLKSLTRQRVLHYIPRKRTPCVVYVQSRVEDRFLRFPPEVYAQRKADYQARIEAMLHYATPARDGDPLPDCRSRTLLAYFGQTAAEPCHICDACIGRQATPQSTPHLEATILRQLSDGRPHRVSQLQALRPHAASAIADALDRLEADGRITISNGRARLIAAP